MKKICFFLWMILSIKGFSQQQNKRLDIFYKDGFFIKGAGIDNNGPQYFKAFADAGGNAFRTWRSSNANAEFDSARKYQLKVALGIEVGQELHGFDYNDPKAVKQQFNLIKAKIDKYKDEPQLLCWVVGNELNLLFDENGGLGKVNPKVYDALEEIVRYIHQVDSIHPVTTTFAGIIPTHVKVASERCPSLDFYSFQIYGGLQTLPQDIEKLSLNKPYIISEYGPLGHWERPSTSWNREIEETSKEKSEGLTQRIQSGFIENTNPLFLGGFAFLWGQKQERTPTWYGMFLPTGECDARVDVLTEYWSGKVPNNYAPLVSSITLNDKYATDNIIIKEAETCAVNIDVTDPDNDPLQYKWELLGEVKEKSEGGAYEAKPKVYSLEILADNGSSITFKLPENNGEYRLFAYVFDGNGKVGTANIPFMVDLSKIK
ncbi:hypothetical protein MY04_3524 [Flammeovirga sp. MY04]|uniref:hypothetical protein n=1 Tax=Flammeovirga sp. MY04 TaxID=1191459 RepID=UPI000B17461C|nr:hypothetical protein [Flammeovirga sp. MY04]ANQ50875.2 hypothetical protein MY04_3524 [Flammeovirga sp. MY04]